MHQDMSDKNTTIMDDNSTTTPIAKVHLELSAARNELNNLSKSHDSCWFDYTALVSKMRAISDLQTVIFKKLDNLEQLLNEHTGDSNG